MANDFFRKSGSPNVHTAGTVSQLKSEFSNMESGFNKFPGWTGNASKWLQVNAGGTAIDAVSQVVANALLTANGYYIFPGANQLIFQWCTALHTVSGLFMVTLPITFPTAILHAIVGTNQPDFDGGGGLAPTMIVPGIDFPLCTLSQVAVRIKGRTSTSGTGDAAGVGHSYRILAWGY